MSCENLTVISATVEGPNLTVISATVEGPNLTVISATVEGPAGPPGPAGADGTSAYTVAALAGAIDGSNDTFTAPSPIADGSELVLINGLAQDPIHYSLSGNSVIFDDPPEPGDRLMIIYSAA